MTSKRAYGHVGQAAGLPALLSSSIVLSLLLVGFHAGRAAAQDPLITEFMAVNESTLLDQDDQSSDWIEIYNPRATALDLEGWSLSDDKDAPGKWRFPAVELKAGGFLVVFASGDDRRNPASELHTNFKLSGTGEFLGLFDPVGAPVSFHQDYPLQVAGASYGLLTTSAKKTPVSAGATARYHVPTTNDLTATWTALDFDDAAWASGVTGIGLDRKASPTVADLIQTDVATLFEAAKSSVYLRIPFDLDAADVSGSILLRLKYMDGVVVHLNGTEVARRNLAETTTIRYNTRATAIRSDADARLFEDIPIVRGDLLRPGRNVLAIQLLGRTSTDQDLFVVPELDLLRVQSVETNNRGYFEAPTPGFPNGAMLPDITPTPVISHESGAYPTGLAIEIIPPAPGIEVRYTLNGLNPTRGSELYAGPIPIAAPTVVRARAYQPGLLPSDVASESYLLVAADVLAFTSNIPLVICSTFGKPLGSNCGGGPYTPGQVLVFQPGGDGRTRLTDPAQVAESAAFRRRGSSTCGFPKFAFNLEVQDSYGVDKDVQVFDFPADSDYVMHGGNNFDRSVMRNPLAYWMSREVGQWAVRSRFVECFFHQGAGPVTMGSYFGVYAFMEKNKRGAERIDVDRLLPGDSQEPEVTGGYIFRRDRVGAGEVAISAGGYDSLVFVYPKQPTTAQRAYITGFLNRTIVPPSLNPNVGSQADNPAIDFQGWIDHHILCFYPKNVDAFRLSGYFFKDRNGPLVMGPVWDYDRTMGCCDDGRAANPQGWGNDGGDGGTLYFGAGGLGSWYSHLFANQPPTGNSPWAKAYRARWRELRQGPLRTENITGQLDAWAAELAEAMPRNYKKWSAYPPCSGSFQGEVNRLKTWLSTRATWIDAQFVEPPAFSPAGGLVSTGTQVNLSAKEGQIYYTLNGPDPKTTAGGVAPEAILYAGPISITENVRIRARTRISAATWSNLAEEVYVTKLLPIVVTEIMYNPSALPGDTQRTTSYDFLEFLNTGAEALSLEGVQLRGVPISTTISFNFTGSAVTRLEPGEYVVVAKNVTAFRERYGDGPKVAGQFTGSLVDAGAEFELRGPLGESVLKVTYDDAWYPTTDGQGYSLVIKDPTGPRESWVTPEAWRPSYDIAGSPGREDLPTNPEEGLQLPGDFTQDRSLNVSDPIAIIRYLFSGQASPCTSPEGTLKLLDVNGDAAVNITDPIFLLNWLFSKGEPPALGFECLPMAGCPEACGGGR